MHGSSVAAAVGVLTILLLSQGPPCCWAEAPAGQEGAAQSPAKESDWDPITKLLAWIQQNEGQVSSMDCMHIIYIPTSTANSMYRNC